MGNGWKEAERIILPHARQAGLKKNRTRGQMAPGASPLTPLSPERLIVAELVREDEFWSAMSDSKI